MGRRATVRLLAAGLVAALAGSRAPVARGQAECAASCGPGETCQACVGYAPGEPDPFPPCPAGSEDARYRCCPASQYNANGLCCQATNPLRINCCSIADANAGQCAPACLPLLERPGYDPVLVDDAHCGVCGRACTRGKVCVAGSCACPDGKQDCGDDCRDCCVDSNCASGERCCSGVCGSCCTDADCPYPDHTCQERACACPPGERACGERCIPGGACCTDADCPRDSGQHCPSPGGACGCPVGERDCGGVCRGCCADTDCGGGQHCLKGTCTCPPGTLVCGGGACAARGHCCTDADCTPGSGKTCTGPGGTCQCSGLAMDTWVECDGVCTNLSTNERHCGGCHLACVGEERCLRGVCWPFLGGVLDECATVMCPAGSMCKAGVCEPILITIPIIP